MMYNTDSGVPRLVVPTLFHQLILNLGHRIPWAGHLGQQKSYDRISRRFYWPGLYKDVKEYCRTCVECQKVAPVPKVE